MCLAVDPVRTTERAYRGRPERSSLPCMRAYLYLLRPAHSSRSSSVRRQAATGVPPSAGTSTISQSEKRESLIGVLRACVSSTSNHAHLAAASTGISTESLCDATSRECCDALTSRPPELVRELVGSTSQTTNPRYAASAPRPLGAGVDWQVSAQATLPRRGPPRAAYSYATCVVAVLPEDGALVVTLQR